MKFWFISTSKNKNVYLFSVGLPSKWYDDGKYHEFLICFNKSSTNPFYFITLADSYHNTPNTAETAADKPPFGVIHCTKLILAPVLLSTHRFHVWILIYVYSRIQTLPCLYKL